MRLRLGLRRAAAACRLRPSVVSVAAFIGLNVAAYAMCLDRDGLGNPFYAAAVESGAHSLHNAFFGSITYGGTMSVDKPPLALWAMEASVSAFGWSSFGMMLPSAVAGVATNLMVVAMVREWSNLWWGLLAGLVALVTPMSLVMFRFNNPDAVLTCLVTLSVWALTSAIKADRRWKLALAGTAVGAALLTKLLAGLLALPVMLIAYLVLATVRWRSRIINVAVLGACATAASCWWFAIVAVTPLSQRPWIDGTPDSSPWNLLLANNVEHLAQHTGFLRSSPPGILRMFNTQELPNYSWWVFLAITSMVLVSGLVAWRAAASRRLPDHKAARPLLVGIALSGCGLFMCAVFSFMTGSYHSYYAVEAVPMLAAGSVLAIAGVWRSTQAATRLLAFALLANAVAIFDMWVLARHARPTHYGIEIFALIACLLISLHHDWRPMSAIALGGILTLAPAGYTFHTWLAHHEGGSPVGGPNGNQIAFNAYPPSPGRFGYPSQIGPGLSNLMAASRGYEYAAAVVRDGDAAAIQLATNAQIYPIGGYRTVPPTGLAEFSSLIRHRRIHYYIPTDFGRPVAPWAPMQTWIEHHFCQQSAGPQKLYDLSRPATCDRQRTSPPGRGPATTHLGSTRTPDRSRVVEFHNPVDFSGGLRRW